MTNHKCITSCVTCRAPAGNHAVQIGKRPREDRSQPMSPFTVSKQTPDHPPTRSALYSSPCLTRFWSMSLLPLPEGWSLGLPGTGGRAWFMHRCFLWMDLKLEWTQALCVWQQWPVTATTDIQALREQTLRKDGQGERRLQHWHLLYYIYIIQHAAMGSLVKWF